jgi:hypothetical protein
VQEKLYGATKYAVKYNDLGYGIILYGNLQTTESQRMTALAPIFRPVVGRASSLNV